MKKLYLTILGVLVLLMPLSVMGCEETAPATTTPLFVTIETFNAEINRLTTAINAKANQAALDAQVIRIDTFTGQVDTYSKAELYTQSEVNERIAAEIAVLKANQTWVTGTTTTSAAGTTVGDYGELISTNGDLELWLERVSGDVSDELRTRDGANDARFDFVVVNLDGSSSHDFTIDLEFEPEDGEATLNINLTPTLTKAEASGNLEYGNPTRTPQPDADSVLRFDQSNEGRILKGDVEDFTVWVDVQQIAGGTTDWEYDIRIKDKD